MLNTKNKPTCKRDGEVFSGSAGLDKIAISVKSHKLLAKLLKENPTLGKIMRASKSEIEAIEGMRNWVMGFLENSLEASKFHKRECQGREIFESLNWGDYAVIRLLDYIDNAGREFEDLNLQGEVAINNPVKMIWLATQLGIGGAKPCFLRI